MTYPKRAREAQLYAFIRLVIIVLAFGLVTPALVHAGEREDTIRGLIDDVRGSERATAVAKVGDLHKSYEGATDQTERRLLALALGVGYLEASPRLALQYLSSAEQASTVADPLLPMIRYYLALALFQGGAYQSSSQIAKALLNVVKGDVWIKRVRSLLIENLYALGDYSSMTQEFKSYSKHYSFSRRQEILAKMAIEAFGKQGDHKAARELLEELARNYPTTEESRWAFHQLEAATCLSLEQGRYQYSERLLLALSRNVVLGAGIEEFLVAAADQPVDFDGVSRVMTPGEKVNFFVRARLFKRALNVVENQYQELQKKPDPNLKAVLVFELGRLHIRMFEPQIAARYFSRFLAEFPKHHWVPRAHEALADALRYSGQPLAASKFYGLALAKRATPLLRWMYFWTLMRGKDYAQALALVEKPGFVTPREGDDPLVTRYWHGKLLDLVGRKDEAGAIYKDILANHAQSFYAMVVAYRYPGLVQPEVTLPAEPAPAMPTPTSGAFNVALAARRGPPAQEASPAPEILKVQAESLSDMPSSMSQRNDVKLVADLMRVGLRDAASAQLASVKWAGFDQIDAFRGIVKMSSQLDDYRPSRNLRYTSFTSLRSLPRNWRELMGLLDAHGEDWKAYYPLAYERLVMPFSSSLRLSPFLVLSIMRNESFYNKEARSGVGAQGLMQLMPYTAMKIATLLHDEAFDIRDVSKPEVNIGYGIYYIDRLLRYYSDSPVLAAAAYNGGPVVVNQWLGTCGGCEVDEFVDSIPYLETRRYVREVMRTMDLYARIYTGKPGLPSLTPMPLTAPPGEGIF